MRLIDIEKESEAKYEPLRSIFGGCTADFAAGWAGAFDYLLAYGEKIAPDSLVKRGRWKTAEGREYLGVMCTNCQKWCDNKSDFCTNCGAKMEEDA